MAAGVKRLEKFGDFVTLDNLVRSYSGVYTHDDIFELDIALVHNMILLQKESDYIGAGTRNAQRAAAKAKK